MTERIECFLQDQCPVFEAGCVFCFARWLEVLPLLPGGVPMPGSQQIIVNGDEPDACFHRGSKRRCCQDLWICRKHTCECTPTERGDIDSAVRRCSECADYQKTEEKP